MAALTASCIDLNIQGNGAYSVLKQLATIALQNGVITDQSEQETALRRAMIKNSAKQYFIFDSSKFSKRQTFKLCSTDDISGVITDLEDCPF